MVERRGVSSEEDMDMEFSEGADMVKPGIQSETACSMAQQQNRKRVSKNGGLP